MTPRRDSGLGTPDTPVRHEARAVAAVNACYVVGSEVRSGLAEHERTRRRGVVMTMPVVDTHLRRVQIPLHRA